MSFEIKGKVIEVGPVEQITDKFKKRDLIIEFAPNPQYPDEVKIEATQDKVTLFDNIYTGDEVEVFFNIRGRKWVNKEGKAQWFNSLVAWRVNKIYGAEPSNVAHPVDVANAGAEDDIPF